MFGDDDINFDLQLEKFDVNTDILKEPAVERIFCLWVLRRLGRGGKEKE